jgi:hypothetical protein
MRRQYLPGVSALATLLALTGFTSAFADTVTTSTIRVGPSGYALPPSSYVVVDPITGVVKGEYTTNTRTIDGIPLTSKYVLMDKSSRKLVATFNDNGELVDISTSPAAETVVISVDSHRARLIKEIDRLQADNKITAAQAESFRKNIAKQFPGTTIGRTITYNNALAADSALTTVESQLMPSSTTTTTVVSPRYFTQGTTVLLPDDLTFRKLQLQKRMDEEYGLGHMNAAQFAQLKGHMDEIFARESQYRVTGVMSDGDANRLNADLDSFQAEMVQVLASNGQTL